MILDSFKGKVVRRFAHIGKEIFKSFPAFTDSDATFTVVGITFIARILASAFHRSPDVIYLRSPHPMSFKKISYGPLNNRTTIALFAVATTKPTRIKNVLRSAVAFTKESGISLFRVVNSFDYSPMTKALSCQVDKEHTELYPQRMCLSRR